MTPGRSGLWVNTALGDLDRIRRLDVPDGTKSSCRSLYLALAELSLEAFHKPFDASRERLAAVACMSPRTVDACLDHLAGANIVRRRSQLSRAGRQKRTRYQLPNLARLNAPINGNGHGAVTPDVLAKLIGD